MAFNFEKLNKLQLRKTEWVMIKYKGFDTIDSGQIATNQMWNSEKMPIFDDDEAHIFIHMVRQSHPSKLQIDKIEYFYRGEFQPTYIQWGEQVYYVLNKYSLLILGHTYTILKTDGEELKIVYDKISLEPAINNTLVFYIHFTEQTGLKGKLPFHNILDIY